MDDENSETPELDVVEELLRLVEVNSDTDVSRVLHRAIGEIEYLRGLVWGWQRGARPLRDFWDAMREEMREEQRAAIEQARKERAFWAGGGSNAQS